MDRQREIGETDKVSLSHFHVFKELRISHFFNNDVNEVLTIFYCLYLRKDFLVLAKQQGIIENHVQQALSASGQFLQQPYIPRTN